MDNFDDNEYADLIGDLCYMILSIQKYLIKEN